MTDALCRRLIAAARDVQRRAYAPYSHFAVGAAALGDDGNIYTGCNVENSSYGLSCCAERNAVFQAVSQGCRTIKSIAIAGDSPDVTLPCGACRQVMAEFCVSQVILAKADGTYACMTMDELLPAPFLLEQK